MSRFNAKVTQIQTEGTLNIVTFDFLGETLRMMSLDLNQMIQSGMMVELAVNPTHIAIAKEFSGEVSYSNQLKAKIEEIQNGKLLSSIKLRVEDVLFESIITLDSSKRMNLQADDAVTLFIKASELSIKKVL